MRPAPPETEGPFVADFIDTLCRLSKGEWGGKPMELRQWQRDLLDDLFALRPDGLRRYRTAYIQLPRKNGKSTLGAALALYFLLADGEPGAEVYSCAGDREQARIVFAEARKMIEAEPELLAEVKLYKNAIEVPSTGAIYRVLSADGALQQGLNPSAVLFDEVHVQKSPDLWTAMTLGSGTRRQPLVIGITTPGYDEDSLAFRLDEYGQRVQSGEVDDPAFFYRAWRPKDPNADYRDPAVWAEANPAYGDFLKPEDFETTVRITPEHEFRRFRLGQWTKTANAWLPFGAWDACKDPTLDLDPSLPTSVGVDMAYSNDSAAVVASQVRGEKVVLRAKVWENPYPPTHSLHDHWKINPFEVEEELRSLYARFPTPSVEIDRETKAGPAFYYDPAWFSRSAPILEGDGLAMVELPQSDARMIPVAQTFYQLITEGKVAHDGDPVLARHVGNGVADRRPRGWRISKPSSKHKIDALIAAAIAAWGAQQPAPPPPRRSAYANRRLMVV